MHVKYVLSNILFTSTHFHAITHTCGPSFYVKIRAAVVGSDTYVKHTTEIVVITCSVKWCGECVQIIQITHKPNKWPAPNGSRFCKMLNNSSSVCFLLRFHVWRMNSAQNMHVNYMSSSWHVVLVLLTFLMCFKEVNRAITCLYCVFFLTVFWLYSDCILCVFWLYLHQTWFYCTWVVPHCIGDQWHMCHTFWWPHRHTKTLYLQKITHIFLRFLHWSRIEILVNDVDVDRID